MERERSKLLDGLGSPVCLTVADFGLFIDTHDGYRYQRIRRWCMTAWAHSISLLQQQPWCCLQVHLIFRKTHARPRHDRYHYSSLDTAVNLPDSSSAWIKHIFHTIRPSQRLHFISLRFYFFISTINWKIWIPSLPSSTSLRYSKFYIQPGVFAHTPSHSLEYFTLPDVLCPYYFLCYQYKCR